MSDSLPQLGLVLMLVILNAGFSGDLPAGDYATVAGLLLAYLGRIPKGNGETVQVGHWCLEAPPASGPSAASSRRFLKRSAGSVAI